MQRNEEWLLNEKYLGERSEEFFRDCERLAHGEPLAYVIGHIPFLDTTIWLDSKPLIPRPETEFWVEKILSLFASQFRSPTTKLKVLDMCAGSGCIGVAVAKAFPQAHVDFVEIDESHHPTIRKNLLENGVMKSRTRIHGGDLFQNVTATYDLILSNPPYIDKTLNRTDASVLAHEPENALFAHNGGFALIEHILRDSLRHLSSDGIIGIEHEPEHVPHIEALAQTLSLRCTCNKDQYDVFRYTILTRENIENMPS